MNELPKYMAMFIAEIKEELKNQGITQCTLAKKACMTETYLSGMLTGKTNMPHKVCSKLAEVLNMKLIMCLGDKGE